MGRKYDRLLTTRQAMEVLGIDWNAIYTYIAEGKLKARKLGGNGKSKRHWRIWYSDLLAFVNSGEEGKPNTELTDLSKKSELSSSPSSPQ